MRILLLYSNILKTAGQFSFFYALKLHHASSQRCTGPQLVPVPLQPCRGGRRRLSCVMAIAAARAAAGVTAPGKAGVSGAQRRGAEREAACSPASRRGQSGPAETRPGPRYLSREQQLRSHRLPAAILGPAGAREVTSARRGGRGRSGRGRVSRRGACAEGRARGAARRVARAAVGRRRERHARSCEGGSCVRRLLRPRGDRLLPHGAPRSSALLCAPPRSSGLLCTPPGSSALLRAALPCR